MIIPPTTPVWRGAKACIRCMRITVDMIASQIKASYSIDEMLSSYPYLEREDVTQTLRYVIDGLKRS